MSDPDRVAAVVTAFLNSQDLHEIRRLVAEESSLLFSEHAELHFDALLKRYSSNPGLLTSIRTRWLLLEHCKSDGIELAFANFFADQFPEPISDVAASALLQHMASPAGVAQLIADRPELLPECQQAVAAAEFVAALAAEMQTPEAMTSSTRRIELARAALRLVDRRLDPFMWAAVRGELANALATSNTAEAIDETIALLRSIQGFYADAGATELLSSTFNNLGNALASRAGDTNNNDLAEALDCFEQALALRPRTSSPLAWAQTQLCMARARVRRQGAGRAPQIAMARRHLELALEELSPHRGHDAWLLATMDLANILMSPEHDARADKLSQAISLLESAIVTAREGADDSIFAMQLQLEDAYQQVAVETRLSESSADEEVLGFATLDGWYCARRRRSHANLIEEWLPKRDELDDWRELVAMEARWGAATMPFRGLLVAVERYLRARVTSGDFTFLTLSQTPDTLTYLWSVANDFAIDDQYELAQVRRGKNGLHRLRRAVRGKNFNDDREAAAQWLERLESAKLSLRSGPSEPVREVAMATLDQINERITRLSHPPGSPIDDPAGFLKDALRGVRRGEAPEVYAALSIEAGLHLLRSETALTGAEIEEAKAHFNHDALPPDMAERVQYGVLTDALRTSQAAIEAAIRAFRSALEVFSRDTHPEIWARGMANLARAFFSRKSGDRRRNIMLSRYGFEQAGNLYAARQMIDELGDTMSDLALLHSRLGDGGDHSDYATAIQYFSAALKIHTLKTHPVQWAEDNFNLADVYRAVAALTGDNHALREAESGYASVVKAISSDERFKAVGATESALRLLGFAIKELQFLDRTGIPQPRTPVGFAMRKTLGRVVFLRPMISSRNLVLENRFRNPRVFAVQFEVEPTVLPLESALYRALGENLDFQTVGGAPEGLGATRFYRIGGEGWKNLVSSMLATADIILMLPLDSSGVRWELEQIVESRALAKVVFIMPPGSSRLDMGMLWDRALLMVRDYGLEMPSFRDDGLIFRLGEDGRAVESFSFDVVWDNTLFQRLAPLLPATRLRSSTSSS